MSDEDIDVEADLLFRNMRNTQGITRMRYRSILKRMVRKGLAQIYYVDGKACIRLTPAGKEWLDAQ